MAKNEKHIDDVLREYIEQDDDFVHLDDDDKIYMYSKKHFIETTVIHYWKKQQYQS